MVDRRQSVLCRGRDDGPVTIHSEHPFLSPEEDRNPVRRLRGRLPSPVTLWTAYDGDRPVGLTVSSVLVADGEPPRMSGLLDPDSDLGEAVERGGVFAVTLLRWQHRGLADAFAGVSPAPGGPFRSAAWSTTSWGPVLAEPVTWAGCRVDRPTRSLGWGMFVEAVIERVELDANETAPLLHWRGRYASV